MAKFCVGERARYVPAGRTSPVAGRYSGQEVVVVRVGPIPTILGEFDYEVEANDEQIIFVAEGSLRKITGSWDEIERTTGFRPSKTRRKSPEREPEAVT